VPLEERVAVAAAAWAVFAVEKPSAVSGILVERHIEVVTVEIAPFAAEGELRPVVSYWVVFAAIEWVVQPGRAVDRIAAVAGDANMDEETSDELENSIHSAARIGLSSTEITETAYLAKVEMIFWGVGR
jgi:hypothetical protein